MVDVIKDLPYWAGTAPQWGLLGVVLTALIAVWPKIMHRLNERRTIDSQERLAIKGGYIGRIHDLEQQVLDCRKNCDEQEERLMAEIKALHEEIFGLRKQHIQEQLSLINAITQTVDAPQLKILLTALESGQRALEAQRVKPVPGPFTDKGSDNA